ncbi:MAG: hypothetical protein AAGA70_13425 [Pseudomonadota bacterium]
MTLLPRQSAPETGSATTIQNRRGAALKKPGKKPLDPPETNPADAPSEIDPDEVRSLPGDALHVIAAGTRLRDARFRRSFAIALFCLFALVVLALLALLFAANLTLLKGGDPALSEALMEAAKDGIPIALSAVTGVFGTAVGFYFGSEAGG